MDVIKFVRKAKKGDKEALLELIMDKKSEYYKLSYVYTQNKEDALDAMEDMIVILYEKINQLKNEESFHSWSKTILVNCAKSIHRKNRRIIFLDTVKDMGYLEKYESKEQNIDLTEQLKELNKDQQEAIKLKYLLDMDYKTIATITKVSEGTVKSRVFNGLKKLREKLGGEYDHVRNK